MTKPTVPEGAKPGLTLRALSLLINGLRRDVDTLKKAVVRAGATTLDGLRDVEVLYDHWTDLPKHGQALRWDTTRDSRFHGLATFADPTVVADYFTVPVTGDGIFGLDDSTPLSGEFLVGSDWDVDRPCLVTVSIIFNGSYSLQPVSPATDPVSYHRAPSIIAQLIDGDSGRVTTPGATFEGVRDDWEIVTPSGQEVKQKPLEWLYLRGRPKLNLTCTVSADAEPGLSGSPELLVITRVTRL